MTKIQGHVKEVLECWPIELVIQTESSRLERVTLAEDCRVSGHGHSISPSEIKVGAEVTCASCEEDGIIGTVDIR